MGPMTTPAKSKKKKSKRDDDDSATSEDDSAVDGYQGDINSCSVEVHFREIIDLVCIEITV